MNVEMKKLIAEGLRKRMGSASQNAYSETLGISPAHLSNILTGKHEAVSAQLWAQMLSLLGGVKLPRIETQNYRDIHAACKDAQDRRRLVAISANTGLGKTTALKAYAAATENVHYMLCAGSMSSREFAQQLSITMGRGAGCSASTAIMRAADELNSQHRPLFILDDAGKLGTKCYPLVQELRDRTEDNAGIVVAGMPFLRKFILQGVSQGWNGFSEFYRRVGYWLDLRRPGIEETAALCGYAGITATKTVTYVHKWASNFGLLNELLENALLATAAGNDINDINVIRALQVGDAHLSL